jgi:hypothetical protein
MQYVQYNTTLHFKFSPRCKRDILSFGMSNSTDRYLATDISEELIDRIFDGQEVKEEWCETLKYSVI